MIHSISMISGILLKSYNMLENAEKISLGESQEKKPLIFSGECDNSLALGALMPSQIWNILHPCRTLHISPRINAPRDIELTNSPGHNIKGFCPVYKSKFSIEKDSSCECYKKIFKLDKMCIFTLKKTSSYSLSTSLNFSGQWLPVLSGFRSRSIQFQTAEWKPTPDASVLAVRGPWTHGDWITCLHFKAVIYNT